MQFFSIIATGIDAGCNNKKKAFKTHGGDLYEICGKAVVDFSALKSVASAVETSIELVEAEGGTVEQVWTQG